MPLSTRKNKRKNKTQNFSKRRNRMNLGRKNFVGGGGKMEYFKEEDEYKILKAFNVKFIKNKKEIETIFLIVRYKEKTYCLREKTTSSAEKLNRYLPCETINDIKSEAIKIIRDKKLKQLIYLISFNGDISIRDRKMNSVSDFSITIKKVCDLYEDLYNNKTNVNPTKLFTELETLFTNSKEKTTIDKEEEVNLDNNESIKEFCKILQKKGVKLDDNEKEENIDFGIDGKLLRDS
jgi:hypothetical protein